MTPKLLRRAREALDSFAIETPSWGFADTGTRFGKFFQDAAAIDLNDKLADAGEVNRVTGCCPTVAVHVLWDFKAGDDPKRVAKLARQHGVQIGAINPNLFQDQCYKWGSFGHNDPAVREHALQHCYDSIAIGQAVGSEYVSLWFADGTNYPGQGSIRERKAYFTAALQACHEKLSAKQTMLVEYKPFEPAFYHTDIADWGMSYLLCKKAGPRSKVLVDTGHHYSAQNIEQIVAWLLDEDMLGGFHFNDRRYADDDLTLGSIDPYQAFRIFHEIHFFAADRGRMPKIAYMIDQSHNEKPKIEATIQTVLMAQELYVKAALVDHAALRKAQAKNNVVDAELELKKAFFTDVAPAFAAWRKANKLPADPLADHRKSGYERQAATERKRRRQELGIVQGGGYA
ncbi:TIM barrel protein [Horticoccus luteus]|uniref:TIM barrel protein n=1 Tax=Horticoccus luteus TaxID=2862869 RepID=A0A8F9TXN6_9BACT|nr:TIM barrel protein [Horticoccus luteus]QYM79902.1 TIM barrel protein [Horticoccus luteus]